MSNTQKIVSVVVAILGIILVVIFGKGLYSPPSDPPIIEETEINSQAAVHVISTSPKSLDGATVSPTQTIEITFNKPLVRDDTRIIVEPKADYKTDLSPDHKTLKITPSFELGKSYTLTIKSGYGTDTGEKLDQDLNFKLQTISYNGV